MLAAKLETGRIYKQTRKREKLQLLDMIVCLYSFQSAIPNGRQPEKNLCCSRSIIGLFIGLKKGRVQLECRQ